MPAPDTLTISAAARLCHVDRRTLQRAIHAGRLHLDAAHGLDREALIATGYLVLDTPQQTPHDTPHGTPQSGPQETPHNTDNTPHGTPQATPQPQQLFLLLGRLTIALEGLWDEVRQLRVTPRHTPQGPPQVSPRTPQRAPRGVPQSPPLTTRHTTRHKEHRSARHRPRHRARRSQTTAHPLTPPRTAWDACARGAMSGGVPGNRSCACPPRRIGSVRIFADARGGRPSARARRRSGATGAGRGGCAGQCVLALVVRSAPCCPHPCMRRESAQKGPASSPSHQSEHARSASWR